MRQASRQERPNFVVENLAELRKCSSDVAERTVTRRQQKEKPEVKRSASDLGR